MIPVEEERSSEEERYGDGFESMGGADDLYSESDDTKPKKTEARHEVEQLTLKDTRNMRIWKIIVFSLMLIASGFVGAGTYFFVRKVRTVKHKDGSLLCPVYVSVVVADHFTVFCHH